MADQVVPDNGVKRSILDADVLNLLVDAVPFLPHELLQKACMKARVICCHSDSEATVRSQSAVM